MNRHAGCTIVSLWTHTSCVPNLIKPTVLPCMRDLPSEAMTGHCAFDTCHVCVNTYRTEELVQWNHCIPKSNHANCCGCLRAPSQPWKVQHIITNIIHTPSQPFMMHARASIWLTMYIPYSAADACFLPLISGPDAKLLNPLGYCLAAWRMAGVKVDAHVATTACGMATWCSVEAACLPLVLHTLAASPAVDQ